MGNTQSDFSDTSEQVSTVIYEFEDLDLNLKNELQKKYDLLQNELYSKSQEIKKLNTELDTMEDTCKNFKNINESLETKNKLLKDDLLKHKNKYNDLEYKKLDIEEKYLENCDVLDSIDYLKDKVEILEKDLKSYIVRYNDEKNLNMILNNKNNTLTKRFNKINNSYNKKQEELENMQKMYNKSNTIENKINNHNTKKKLYDYINSKIKSEPYVIYEIINHIIKIILTRK